jgi:hypothetical protein
MSDGDMSIDGAAWSQDGPVWLDAMLGSPPQHVK